MSSVSLGTHPVLVAVSAVEAALAQAGAVDPVFMTPAEKEQALLGLTRARDRLEELTLRILATAEDLADRDGARDPAAWLATHARQDPGECRRRLRLARLLDEHPTTAHGVRDGTVNLAQAQVILAAVTDLPAEIDPALRAAAEERLQAEAATFGPRQLRILGRRVLDVLAPGVGEGLEARLLAREEAHAARRTYLTTRRNGDGTTDLRIRVADLVATRLLTYLEAFTSPRRTSPGTPTPGTPPDQRPHEQRPHEQRPHQQRPYEQRPYEQRLGAAFGSFLEAVDPARLPLHGGDATTVLVTVPLETLQTGTGVALVGDQPISAGEARRLACTAAIIPVVLDGASQVLDAGRSRRLYSSAQRRALAITHPTCATEGCDIPAAWCEAHHATQPWSHGGSTDLADGMLLCSYHHHRAHDHHYEPHRHGNTLTFHRRT